MTVDMWEGFVTTPPAEVRRRAAIIGEIAEVVPVVVDGAERFAWNDSGGQSAVWYFTPDGRAMLLTFDHESELNLYGRGGYPVQESIYRGVPDDLVGLVRNRPEYYESLNHVDEATGHTIHHAGGVFWFDGEQWREADGLLAYCEQKGLDPLGESGFVYCTEAYLFGLEFTAESVVESRAHWYDDEAERVAAPAEIREMFARHG